MQDQIMQNKKKFLGVLIFPFTVLILLTTYKFFIQLAGTEVVLPISGYDPRDLLSGHYLIYNIEYGAESICTGSRNNEADIFYNYEQKYFIEFADAAGHKYIKGKCQGSRFIAGIERFYVNENRALELEQLVRDKKAEIVLSVTSDGKAQVKDLLIEGQPFNK